MCDISHATKWYNILIKLLEQLPFIASARSKRIEAIEAENTAFIKELKPNVVEIIVPRYYAPGKLSYNNVNLDSPFMEISYWEQFFKNVAPDDSQQPLWYFSDKEKAEFGIE